LSPQNPQSPDTNPDGSPNKGRALSTSKRAEQNRRAQRAFRERRDARVKSLEQRAILLEETIQKAEEANRRWEECRVLVDQLRHENAMLRTALDDAGVNSDNIPTTLPHTNGHSSHDVYDDLTHDRTNGVDSHTTIIIEEAGSGSPAKKRKRREEADMDHPRMSVA